MSTEQQPSRAATEAEMRGVMLAVTLIGRDLHRLLISKGLQTTDEAIQRLAELDALAAVSAPATTTQILLRTLQIALSLPETDAEGLSRMVPAGEAD